MDSRSGDSFAPGMARTAGEFKGPGISRPSRVSFSWAARDGGN